MKVSDSGSKQRCRACLNWEALPSYWLCKAPPVSVRLCPPALGLTLQKNVGGSQEVSVGKLTLSTGYHRFFSSGQP